MEEGNSAKMFRIQHIQLNALDWCVAITGLVATVFCPFGESQMPLSVPAVFKWAGVMLLLSSLTHQIVQFQKWKVRSPALWLGLFLVAMYIVLLLLGVSDLIMMYPCQSVSYCALAWLLGVLLRDHWPPFFSLADDDKIASNEQS